jgi:ribosomal protein S18 acetylase RimI-like enzyme
MIIIRKALPGDAEFIAAHTHRLLNFNLPGWRVNEKSKMIQADIQHITKALLKNNSDDCVFVAIDTFNKPCGFIRVVLQTDYYTGERHAHVNDIVVITEAEGQGVGKALLQKADEWAVAHNSRWITLNVFEENKHARAVYEKNGYNIEWIKYLKQLKSNNIKTKR